MNQTISKRLTFYYFHIILWFLFLSFAGVVQARVTDPLPSWNNGQAKLSIVRFVKAVTNKGGPDFVPPAERIATFDNDGTLWCEQPMYVQLAFALDRVKAEAPEHPEWKTTEPFKSVLANDMKGVMASGGHGLIELVMTTHQGMTVEEFNQISKKNSSVAGRLPHSVIPTAIIKCFSGRQRIMALISVSLSITPMLYVNMPMIVIQPLAVLIRPWTMPSKWAGQWST